MAEQDWSTIHQEGLSWRKQLIGGINDVFVVPRYVRLFHDVFGRDQGLSVFEIGAGNGDMSLAMLASNKGQIGRWVTSEQFAEGVAWLRSRGLESLQADAQNLPVEDASFDAIVEFDVMHHVPAPRLMAREMMRAGRGRLLLVESNGLSIFRKLKELTPGHRAAGERSYTPWAYRSFFKNQDGFRIKRFSIFPFLFPFKVPGRLLPGLVAFNKVIEKVPILRWFCSSVAITVDYERA